MSGGFPTFPELCAGNDQGTDTANSRGTAFTCGNNSYGSYTQIVASTPQDTSWVTLNVLTDGTANFGNEFMVKLAVGAAASEVVLVADLVFEQGVGGIHGIVYSFPLRIPAGSRVSIAGFQNGHTDTGYASIILWDSGFVEVGISGYDSMGITSDHGTQIAPAVANTKTAYVQITASTAKDYCGFFVGFDTGTVGTTIGKQNLVDIAIGGAGSEKIIIPNLYVDGGTLGVSSNFYQIPIPAGTRIAARAQNVLGSGVIGVALYGAYP